MLKQLVNRWITFKTTAGTIIDAKLLEVDALFVTVQGADGKKAAYPLTTIDGHISEGIPPHQRTD